MPIMPGMVGGGALGGAAPRPAPASAPMSGAGGIVGGLLPQIPAPAHVGGEMPSSGRGAPSNPRQFIR